MDKNSRPFTFIFATVMVVMVAVLLALAAIILGPYQARNVRLEKMQNILSSIGIKSEAKEAEKVFQQHIKEQLVLNQQGQLVKDGVNAFDVDLKVELDKVRAGKREEQLFPLFVFSKDGKQYYVIPVR